MAQNDEIILININGADRPGVTAALTEILAKNNAVILDIGQADIHNHLSLGILFQSTEGNSGDILKELLFKSYKSDGAYGDTCYPLGKRYPSQAPWKVS